MKEITLDQFVNQWFKGKGVGKPMANIFAKNVEDFTTVAGDYSRRFFQMSFASSSFYASGKTWAPRKSRWGKRFSHPIMNDTGKLKAAIKGEATNRDNNKGRKSSVTGRSTFKRVRSTYEIYTDEKSFPEKGKRGRNNKAVGYAAIHNTDPKSSKYKVNQYSSRTPVQRQFIGYSDKLNRYINTHFVPILFREFPK